MQTRLALVCTQALINKAYIYAPTAQQCCEQVYICQMFINACCYRKMQQSSSNEFVFHMHAADLLYAKLMTSKDQDTLVIGLK